MNIDVPAVLVLPTQHLQVSYTLCGDQNGFSILLHELWLQKTDSRSFYTPPPRRFPVVKTYSLSFYKPTHVAMVKADSPSFQKHCTRFAAVKKDSPSFCKSPTHFVVFKMDYLIFYKVPTCFAVLKTNPTCFVVVKMDSPSFYKPFTRFVVIKTDSPCLLNTLCWSK